MPQLGTMLGNRIRVLLDGLIGALSMATLIWVVFYPALEEHLSTRRRPGNGLRGWPIRCSTPSMVVVAMIVTIRRSNSRFDPRIVLFGVGMVAPLDRRPEPPDERRGTEGLRGRSSPTSLSSWWPSRSISLELPSSGASPRPASMPTVDNRYGRCWLRTGSRWWQWW